MHGFELDVKYDFFFPSDCLDANNPLFRRARFPLSPARHRVAGGDEEWRARMVAWLTRRCMIGTRGFFLSGFLYNEENVKE